MSQVLSGLDFCLAYLDDIFIYNASWEEHLQYLETVLSCLKAVIVMKKLSKYKLSSNIYIFRTFISKQGIHPPPDKIMAITNLAEPKNIDELCHFLRLTGNYRRFVPLFTDIMKLLNYLGRTLYSNGQHNVSQLLII